MPLGPVAAPTTPPPAPAAVAPKCSIELYGDSILRGEHLGASGSLERLANPPAAELHRLLPLATITDRSKAGQTATEAARTFPNDTRTGNVVVIEHGSNDLAQGLPLEPPLRAMAEYAKAEGRTVVLTGLNQQQNFAEWAEYVDAHRRVAGATGAHYADWPSVAGKNLDGAHPDQTFSDALVAKLANTISAAAPECTP